MRQAGFGSRLVAGLVAGFLVLAQAPAPPASAPPAAGPSAPDAWLPRGSADLVLLDKLRAQPSTITLRTGQSATFGAITVTLRSCVTRPPDLPQNSAAFLEVADSRGTAPVFRGWVLSNTPAVGQLEHPVYDLRLVACR